MCTSNGLQAVDVVEFSRNLVSEQPSSTTWTHCPRVDFFRITPYKVTEGTLVRNFLSTSDHPDLVDGSDLRAEATVHTEDSPVHNGGENKEVKDLATGLPN